MEKRKSYAITASYSLTRISQTVSPVSIYTYMGQRHKSNKPSLLHYIVRRFGITRYRPFYTDWPRGEGSIGRQTPFTGVFFLVPIGIAGFKPSKMSSQIYYSDKMKGETSYIGDQLGLFG